MQPFFYLRTAHAKLSNSKLFTCVYALGFIFPFVMLVVGFSSINKCPLDPLIPIWLIIGGFIWLIGHSINFYLNVRHIRMHRYGQINETLDNKNGTISKVTAARMISHFFILAWLIAATTLVFQNFQKKSDDQNSPFFCNYYCFHVLFAKMIYAWVCIVIVLLTATILIFLGCLKK